MREYVTIPPRAFVTVDYEQNAGSTAAEVFESDRGPVDTGLLDARGQPIGRLRETVPLGFHVAKES